MPMHIEIRVTTKAAQPPSPLLSMNTEFNRRDTSLLEPKSLQMSMTWVNHIPKCEEHGKIAFCKVAALCKFA